MARFVLVHGAFSGAWIWGPLTDRLRAAGHSVEVFDLPGSGDDHRPASEVTLDACATRLCEVLASGSEPAVVAGNSMGGIVATQGAARCPSRVRALVYVTAFLPKDGQSLLDLGAFAGEFGVALVNQAQSGGKIAPVDRLHNLAGLLPAVAIDQATGSFKGGKMLFSI